MTAAVAFLTACGAAPEPTPPVTNSTTIVADDGCHVENWGPREAYAGERFSPQPEGYSAFWFKAVCAPHTMLVFDGRRIAATQGKSVLTAAFNADGVLQQAGDHQVGLYDPATRRATAVGVFRVRPARAPVTLPPAPPRHWPAMAPSVPPPVLIAHAGGGLNGQAYLNSLDALDYNYALGHRVFELDFAWTRDAQLVCIHDWQDTLARLFPGLDSHAVPTHAEFMAATMADGHHQIDLPRLKVWLAAHPDARIVTDIRGRNVHALQRMKAVLDAQQRQIIPQMYHAFVYPDLRALGYDQIIFTLYSSQLDTDSLLAAIAAMPLYAVTINPTHVDAQRIIKTVAATGTPVYVHTFDTVAELQHYQAEGVHGVYTNFLHVQPDGQVTRQ